MVLAEVKYYIIINLEQRMPQNKQQIDSKYFPLYHNIGIFKVKYYDPKYQMNPYIC